MDSLLDTYLAAGGEETEKLLEDLLVEEAEPRIRKVILRKLGPECPDIDDVCAEVLVEAAAQLRAWKGPGASRGIGSFADYVAACSFNAASEYLRRKYPRWRRMRDRIHYLLRHDPRLAVWESARGWLGGVARWKGQDSVAPVPSLDDCERARNLRPADSLNAVLLMAEGAVELDALVELAARLWGVALDRQGSDRGEPAAAPRFDEHIDQRRYAERLWQEILALPQRQRQALLLNIPTDGLDVFLLFGVISFRSLADAVAIEAQEFALLWKGLPLDDLTIAARLQATRQQVINLRKSARKRLANRLRANTDGRFASSRKG
jgi:RNA polymerase sigma factor (sigma-70 family)